MSTMMFTNNVTNNNSVKTMQDAMRITAFAKSSVLPKTNDPDRYKGILENAITKDRELEHVDELRAQAIAVAKIYGKDPTAYIESLQRRALEAAGFNCSLQELPEMRSFYVMQLTEDPNPEEVKKVISDIDFVLSL